MGGPRYPNQQLRSVSLETYFPGRFSVASGLERVQERYERDFPHVYVPNVQQGEPLTLRPHQLRSADGSESLAVSLNQATYISFAYPGATVFIARACRLLTTVLEECKVPDIDRVIYRYENEIGISPVEGAIPVGKVLKLPLPEWSEASRGLVDLDVGWTRRSTHGQLALRAVSHRSNTGTTLNITIASIVRPAGKVECLETFAQLAHDDASQCFEGMITDDYRKLISSVSSEEE